MCDQSSRQNPHAQLGLDGVKRFFVARKLIALEQAAFLAGRTGAHVRLRERLVICAAPGWVCPARRCWDWSSAWTGICPGCREKPTWSHRIPWNEHGPLTQNLWQFHGIAEKFRDVPTEVIPMSMSMTAASVIHTRAVTTPALPPIDVVL